MQLSDKAQCLLRDLLRSNTWSLRRASDLARWKAVGRQLINDGESHFDEQHIRQFIYQQLGGHLRASGRLQDEVELRIRLVAAVFDFSRREGQLSYA